MSVRAKLQAQLAERQSRHQRAREIDTLGGEEQALPRMIPIEDISENPFQPRISFDEEALQQLAESIREEGLLQPLVLRPNGIRGYQLIAGERRLRACRLLQLSEVPALVSGRSDLESARSALSENLQRASLSDLEVSRSILQIQSLAEKSKGPLSRSALARLAGVSRPALYRYLSFQELPSVVLDQLAEDPSRLSAVAADQIAKLLNEVRDEGRYSKEELEKILSEQFELFLADRRQTQRQLINQLQAQFSGSREEEKTAAPPQRREKLLRDGRKVGQITREGEQLRLKISIDARTLKASELQRLERLLDALFELTPEETGEKGEPSL